MLYEAELACPYQSTYQQHQYLASVFSQLDEEYLASMDQFPRRDYVWCENNGVLYIRRDRPTNELPWHPVEVPPLGTMINFQLKARCRRNIEEDIEWLDDSRVLIHRRQTLQDPGECLAWLERNADRIGLRIEDAEVEETSNWIGKKSDKRVGFDLRGSYFEGIAQVTNPALFERGLATGIGDSKAFGFGYMFFWRRGQYNARQ